MHSEHIKLDSHENTTNLDSEGSNGYKFISKWWKHRCVCCHSELTEAHAFRCNIHFHLHPKWGSSDYTHFLVVVLYLHHTTPHNWDRPQTTCNLCGPAGPVNGWMDSMPYLHTHVNGRQIIHWSKVVNGNLQPLVFSGLWGYGNH